MIFLLSSAALTSYTIALTDQRLAAISESLARCLLVNDVTLRETGVWGGEGT